MMTVLEKLDEKVLAKMYFKAVLVKSLLSIFGKLQPLIPKRNNAALFHSCVAFHQICFSSLGPRKKRIIRISLEVLEFMRRGEEY